MPVNLPVVEDNYLENMYRRTRYWGREEELKQMAELDLLKDFDLYKD